MRYPVDNLVVYDLEVSPNYFLAGFELPDGTMYQYDFNRADISQFQDMCNFINWVESNDHVLAGFNSLGYDDPVLSSFIASPSVDTAYAASVNIIERDAPYWDFPKDVSSIDLMQILPGRISLKKIGVCLGHQKLQELPVSPHVDLTPEQMDIIKDYNKNDLRITRKLANYVHKELVLRQDLSNEYNVDLRSKGEAACAELALCSVMQRRTGLKKTQLKDIARDNINANPSFNVKVPTWWNTLPVDEYPALKVVIAQGNTIFARTLHVDQYKIEEGAFECTLFIGDRWYQMGYGGLHSVDASGCWVPRADQTLMDVDVTSYYPAIMLTQSLSPRHWVIEGVDYFKETFGAIVSQRIEAKKAGNKAVADRLKIVANSSFGKTNDQYSALYDPYTMGSVTVTGQLALLALVAMIHDVGGSVVSANTDGITILYDTVDDELIRNTISQWEALTEFDMEYCEYSGFYQRDVNNYIARTTDGEVKKKGIFNIPELGGADLRHTPNAQIISRAVIEKLDNDTDITLTITECRDLQEFLLTQQASKGWDVTWKGEPIGNMVRFYKSTDGAEIIKTPAAGSNLKGNAGVMSNSSGSVPVPDLPNSFDSVVDIDYDYYIREAEILLVDITRAKRPHYNTVAKLFESEGMCPAIIKKGKPNRKRGKFGATDFASMKDDEEFAVCTGRDYGVLCKVEDCGHTVFYKVHRKYPTRTRESIRNNEGFRLYFGASMPAPPYSRLHDVDEDFIELFYTPSELRRARV